MPIATAKRRPSRRRWPSRPAVRSPGWKRAPCATPSALAQAGRGKSDATSNCGIAEQSAENDASQVPRTSPRYALPIGQGPPESVGRPPLLRAKATVDEFLSILKQKSHFCPPAAACCPPPRQMARHFVARLQTSGSRLQEEKKSGARCNKDLRWRAGSGDGWRAKAANQASGRRHLPRKAEAPCRAQQEPGPRTRRGEKGERPSPRLRPSAFSLWTQTTPDSASCRPRGRSWRRGARCSDR